jgi:hypothetical protein
MPGTKIAMTTVARPAQRVVLTRKMLLWLLALLLVFWIACLPRYLRIKKSAQWPSAPGVMTSSFIQRGICKNVPCYQGRIAYRYRVENTEYTGTAFDLGRSHWAAQESWQKVLDRYPIGKAVSVYYEPGNPTRAVLEPGLVGETLILYKMVSGMTCFFGLSLAAALAWYHDPEVSVARLAANSREKL